MALEWFAGWMGRHADRIPRFDWPEPDSEFWKTHEALFERLGIDPVTAERASRDMAEAPPDHLTQMVPALRAALRKAADLRPRAPTSNPAADTDSDRIADANWAGLTEEARELWRQLVDERMPTFAKSPRWREGLAKAWAFEPESVPKPYVPRSGYDSPRRRQMPRPVFHPYNKVFKGDMHDGKETQEAIEPGAGAGAGEATRPEPDAGRPERPDPRRGDNAPGRGPDDW